MIRDFIMADYEKFMELSDKMYHSDASSHAVPPEHFTKTFEMIMSGSPIVRGLMLLSDDQPAGYCQLSFTHSTEAGGLVVWIEEIYIDEAFRGKGLGTELFSFLEQEYKGLAARFRLEIMPSNTGARRLYERLGFSVCDYIPMIRELN